MDIWSFLNFKKSENDIIENCHIYKKCILKKKLKLMLLKKQIKFQSKIFYADFLNYRPYNKMPISIRFLIEKIYKRLSFNYHYLNRNISFDKLLNAGIFNEKVIYKINVDSKEKLEKEIKALSIIYKYIDFRTIFLLDESVDNDLIKKMIYENASTIDYKIVFMKDINLNFLYEINKLNLNYKLKEIAKKIEDFYFFDFEFKNSQIKWNSIEYKDKSNEVVLTKFIKIEESFKEANQGYFIKFNEIKRNKRVKFNINYKLKSDFFNIEKKNEYFKIKYFNKTLKDDVFYFSQNIKSFEIRKVDRKIFLIMHFTLLLKKNENNYFILSPNFKNLTELNFMQLNDFLFKNNIKIDEFFRYKLFIKDNDFNKFFNRDLKILIIKEKLINNEKFNFSVPFKIKKIIEKNFNIELSKVRKFNSYFDIYMFFIKDFLDIREKSFGISLNPKKEYYNNNFKIIFLSECGKNKSIYVQQNSELKGLEVGDVFYTNLNLIDLTLINKVAKLCI